MNNHFYEAAYQGVKALLYRQFFDVNTGKLTDPCISSDTAIKALDKAISQRVGKCFITSDAYPLWRSI